MDETLTRLPLPKDWEAGRNCTLADAWLFDLSPYAGESKPEHRERLTAAQIICGECPIQRACLQNALDLRLRGVIAGGKGIKEKSRSGEAIVVELDDIIFPGSNRALATPTLTLVVSEDGDIESDAA